MTLSGALRFSFSRLRTTRPATQYKCASFEDQSAALPDSGGDLTPSSIQLTPAPDQGSLLVQPGDCPSSSRTMPFNPDIGDSLNETNAADSDALRGEFRLWTGDHRSRATARPQSEGRSPDVGHSLGSRIPAQRACRK